MENIVYYKAVSQHSSFLVCVCVCKFIFFHQFIQVLKDSTDNWPAYNMTSVSDEFVSKSDICWTEHLWPHVENQDTEKLLYSTLHFCICYY
jgi:glycine betaine/choline ABC-type transport system substrate-binding protein